MSASSSPMSQSIRRLDAAWTHFWFAPVEASAITRVRVAVCCVALIWWLSFLDGVGTWFGPEGLLNTTMSAQFVEFEETARWQHWSPLWWTDNTLAYQGWIAVGAGLSLLAALGIGGRVTLTVLLLMAISWIHRITWIQGPIEPAMVAMLGYLIISPGKRLFEKSLQPRDPHWLHRLPLRLIQVHWWLLVAAGLLSQLASLVWWRGEAVWWLASSGHSTLLSIDHLGNSPTLVNGLTHGMILVQAIALWLSVVPPARGIGIFFGLLSAGCIGLIADQTLYALLLASCLLAWAAPSQDAEPAS